MCRKVYKEGTISKIYVIGTCDTKYSELKFVKDTIEKNGIPTLLIDVGTKRHNNKVDITNKEVSIFHPHGYEKSKN